jgi:hypothetical protein
MLRSNRICRGLHRVSSCACLAIFLLLLSTGCDSSTKSPTADKGTAAREAAAPPSANKPDSTSTPGSAAKPEEAAARDKDATAEPPLQATKPSANNSGGVKVSGRVVLQGSTPARRIVNTTKDAMCAGLHSDKQLLDEDLLVSSAGGVKNAFVRVHRGAPKQAYPMPEKPAELNQRGCMFQPRVQGVRVGQRLLVGNGDPMTHNVRTFTIANAPFNFGQPPDTAPRERVFERAEREIEVACDFHPWMHAYIFVMDHPFFSVSAEDGAYSIDGLPPGEYVLETWHEKLGKQKKTVTVGGENLVDVNFALTK